MLRSPTRRLFAAASLVTAIFATSCAHDITGPSGVRYARGIAIQPVFPALASQATSAGVAPFTQVHVVLLRSDQSVALDKLINIPLTATQLSVTLDVPLAQNAPASGEPLSLTLAYLDAQGVTLFQGGPFAVLAVPTIPGTQPPPPVPTPVTYVGPGANATSVIISPHAQSVLPGTPFTFTAVAFDDSGKAVAGAPIVFTSSNPSVAALTSSGSGTGVAGAGIGTATITAQLLTGPSDVATLSVQSAATVNWTGAIDANWNNAANWSPAQVPTDVDSVVVGFGNFIPTISVPAAVHSLVLNSCTSINNLSTLTITGTYYDNSNSCLRSGLTKPASATLAKYIGGTGTIILSGTGNFLGYLSASSVQFTGGVHTLVGASYISGPTTVSGSAVLNMGSFSMDISGDFSTTGSGVLQMQSTTAALETAGNATFAGGVETGLLTDGSLRVEGNFTASGTKFDATGTFNLQMTGCNSGQNVDFTSTVAGHGIRNLEFSCAGAKTITGTPTVTGNVINNSTSPIDGPATITLMGTQLNANGSAWNVANTVINTATALQLNAYVLTTNLTISGGTVQLPNDTFTQLTGNVMVTGTNSTLDINGNSFYVTGDFQTASGGRFRMTDSNELDYVQVTGNATFAGGSTTGLLTHGVIQITGNFTQGGGAPDAYAASGTHQTEIGTQFFGIVGGQLRSVVAAPGSVRLPSVMSADAPPSLLLKGVSSRAAALAAPGLAQEAQIRQARTSARAARLEQARSLMRAGLVLPGQAANPRAAARVAAKARVAAQISALPALATAQVSATRASLSSFTLTESAVSFANPGFGVGKSHFATAVISATVMDMASDVYMDGQLYASDDNTHVMLSNNALLTSRGASVFDFQFNNTRWALVDGAEVFQLSQVLFTNMSPTVNQFTIQRTATGLTGSIQPLFDFSFDNQPTTGHYISATDTDGSAPDALFIDMQTPTPGASGGFIQLSGGATTNWLAAFNWTGLGTTDSWDDPANWSTGFAPLSNDDVIIKAGTPRNPLIDNVNGAFIRNLTIEAGKEIDLIGNPVFVLGNLVGPIATEGVVCQDGGQLILFGFASNNGSSVSGKFCNVDIEGNYKVAGPANQLVTSGDMLIDGTGNLTLNGGRVDVGGVGGTLPAEFDTFSSGTLTMTNAADQMFVGSFGAYFEGGSTTGLLTAGTLTLVNSSLNTTFNLGAADAFAPSGTHKVVFTGNSTVSFGDPTQSFLRNADLPTTASLLLSTDVTVTGTFSHSGTGTATLGASLPNLTLTTSGLNSTQPLSVQFVMVNFVNGTTNTTFNNVTWSAFPVSFTGDVFTVNRSDAGTLTFTNHNFTAITLNGGHYLTNRGTATVHMATPSPTTVTNQILQFPGLIIWP